MCETLGYYYRISTASEDGLSDDSVVSDCFNVLLGSPVHTHTSAVSVFLCPFLPPWNMCLSVILFRGIPMWPLPIMHRDMGPHPQIPYQTWDLPPPPLLTSGGHRWRPVQTCSLENQHLPYPPNPHRYWDLVMATATRTVGKRAVRILLECCVVATEFALQKCVKLYEEAFVETTKK